MSNQKNNKAVNTTKDKAEKAPKQSHIRSKEGETLKVVPSFFERAFADFTYKFVKFIPETVHPNVVTTIGIICGMLGAFCFFLGSFSKYFFIAAILGVITHIVCDNIDGYMARTRNQKSLRGGFFDIMSDTVVSTFTVIFIGMSSFCHMESAALIAPLYGIHMLVTLHYIMIFNEFPFPPFGPFEIHLLFIITAVVNMVFGKVTVMHIASHPIYIWDAVFAVIFLGTLFEIGKNSFRLFFRLKKEGR